MKISNEKILQYVDALGRCNSVTGFPGMIIAIARRKMSEEIAEYVKEKQRIFEKYGKKQEDGWIIPKDSHEFKKSNGRDHADRYIPDRSKYSTGFGRRIYPEIPERFSESRKLQYSV